MKLTKEQQMKVDAVAAKLAGEKFYPGLKVKVKVPARKAVIRTIVQMTKDPSGVPNGVAVFDQWIAWSEHASRTFSCNICYLTLTGDLV